MSGHDRRGFLKALLRDAASAAQEVREAFKDEPAQETVEPFRLPAPQQAPPSRELLPEERLLELCRELGLESRIDDVRRLARTSVRLTRATGPSKSRVGGLADLPPEFVWPTYGDRDLAYVGQVSLDELAATGADLLLPADGLLLFFYDLTTSPSGLDPSHRGGARVLVIDGASAMRDTSHPPSLRPLPVQPSCELMVPSPWSFQAEALALSDEEAER